MKKFYTIVGVVAVGVIWISILLLPNSDQLEGMLHNEAEINDESTQALVQKKQQLLEQKIADGTLDSETVSDLADTYVNLERVDKAIEIMERYHQKNPTDIRMLDKLGVLYYLARQDTRYVAIIEEENELAPSANIANILQKHYSMLYGNTLPDKSIKIARQLIALQPDNAEHYKVLIYYLLLPGQSNDEAIAAIKDFQAHCPDQMQYDFMFPLVDRLIQQGKLDEAYADSSSWITQHPDSPAADMARMFFNAHRPDLALKLLNENHDRIAKEPKMFLLYAEATMETNPSAGFKLASDWMTTNPEDIPMLEQFGDMLFAKKRYHEVIALLDPYSTEVGFNDHLQNLYRESLYTSLRDDLTSDPKQALQVALEQMKTHPDDMKTLQDIGNIFFADKRYNDIVTLYKPHKKQVLSTQALRDIYRESLIASLKEHPENLPELASLFEDELKSPQTTPARRKELLYALVDSGAGKNALPYARQYAFQWRGDWVFLYEDFLKKLHQKRELSDFRQQYVHTVKLTDKEKSYFAARYLEDGNKAEAVRLLWQLAENRPSTDQNVRLLLYIWGISPGNRQLVWIEKRAFNAQGEEKIRWLQILMNVRAYQPVIRIVSGIPANTRPVKMWKLYLSALKATKNKVQLEAELTSAINAVQNEEPLAFYAKTAKEQGEFAIAGTAYEKLIAIDPSHIEYLKERGMMAYYQGKPETAKNYLNQYYTKGGKDATALFYYAELLQQRSVAQAKPLFEETVSLMEKAPSLTLEERVLKIHSLVRLHRNQQANNEMQTLLAQHPDNLYLRLDYVEYLIDTQKYDNAEKRLGHALDVPPAPIELSQWRINSKHIVRTEKLANRNELLLHFDKATAQISEARQLQNHHPQWIASVYPGYDTVVLIARQQTTLNFTTEGNATIVTPAHMANRQLSGDSSLPIRKELLQARIEEETHRTDDALKRLYELDKAYPDNVAVTTALAGGERGNGKRLVAMDFADKAHALEPENNWVNVLLADLKKDDQPYARLDLLWQHLADNDQFISEFSGVAPVNRNVKLGFVLDNDWYAYKGLQRSDGSIGNGSGAAQRGELDGLYEFESGILSKSALYLNQNSLGAGEKLTLRDALGTANAYVEYNRADWTFTERLADDVTRNRIGIQQTYSPKPGIYSYFGGAATEYNQNNKDNVTQSVSLDGGINVPLGWFNAKWATLPVTVGYGLDAEYVTSSEYGATPAGDAYRLYPLISREVHFIYGTYTHSFDETLVGDVTGGYAYDRMTGDSGPSVALSATKNLDYDVEAQFRISHGISFTQPGEGVTTMSAYLLHKF